jgi:Family of unknown function (DUF6152)
MKRLVIGALIAAGAVVQAQLPVPALYDEWRRVTLDGVVTRVAWANPRAYVFVDVRESGGTASAGTVANWAIEIGNPLDLEQRGWSRTTVRIGDSVSVEAVPARDSSKRALMSAFWTTRPRARVFSGSPRASASESRGPAPRWPDGQVRLGPPAGRKGYWGAPSLSAMSESGSKVSVRADGLLTNLSDADRVAPFQPWAKAVYLQRQRTLLKDDPAARCLPTGGPRQFHTPNGFQFVEQRDLGRILVLFGGGNRNWRIIYTDGRPLGQAAEAVPSYYGSSVGRWEKDTLVVESVGYNERFWMTNGGLPHTEALRLLERFSRPDLNTLRYEVTVDDPRTYTRPWRSEWTVRWVPDREIEEFFCEENAESTFIR